MNPILQAMQKPNNNLKTQFEQFRKANEGKTIEQIAAENGVDINKVKMLQQVLKIK